jgi:hypothetical protein
MFIIYGKREAKIKDFSDNSNCCTSCKAFDLHVRVYRRYFHVFFIPFMPIGDKRADIRCYECTEPIRTELLKKVYEKYTRTPIYLYTILLLLTVMIGLLVFAGIQEQRDRASWIAKPRVGDVYKVSKRENDATTYYFLRIAEINGSAITVYHNKLMYLSYVNQFNPDDHFVKEEEMHLRIEEVQQMYENDEITSVERGYNFSTGFDRIQ